MPDTSGLNAALLLAATRSPEVEDLSTVRARMQAQRLQAEQLKGAQLENKTHQNQLDQTEAINRAYRDSLTVGPDGTPTIDKPKMSQALSASGHGSAIPAIIKGIIETEKSSQELANSKLTGQKTANEIGEQESDFAGDLGATVKAANYDGHLFLTLAQQAIASKHVEPGHVQPIVQEVVSAYQQDPSGEGAKAVVKKYADGFIAGSRKQQALSTARATADARTKTVTLAEAKAQEERDVKFLNAAAAAGSQTQLDQLRAVASKPGSGVSAEAVAKLPPMFSPANMQQFGRSLMSAEQRTQADQAAANFGQTEKRDAQNAGFRGQEISQGNQRLAIERENQGIKRIESDPFGVLGINQKPLQPGQPGQPQALTGEALLATLPPAVRVRVQAIASGRETLSAREKGSPSGRALQTFVEQYDPTWSEQRAQVRRAFAVGPDGRNIGNINTAVGHVAQMHEAAKAMNNHSWQPGNALYNYIATKFGSDKATNYQFIMQAFAGEAASALKGNATDPEIAHVISTLGNAQSPQQAEGVTLEALHTLGKKLKTYDERWQAQAQGDPWTPILPSARAVFNRYGFDPLAKEYDPGLPGQKTQTQQKTRPPLDSFWINK